MSATGSEEGWVVYPLHISLKAVCSMKGGETVIRRVRLADPTYDRMLDVVRGWLGHEPAVAYEDEDGDTVTIGSYLEWQECVRLFLTSEGKSVKLHLEKQKKTSKRMKTPELPCEHIAVEDQWDLIKSVLHERLDEEAMQGLQVGKIPSGCNWLTIHSVPGSVQVSRCVLRQQQPLLTPTADATTAAGVQTTSAGSNTTTVPTESIAVGPLALQTTSSNTEEGVGTVDAGVGNEVRDVCVGTLAQAHTAAAATQAVGSMEEDEYRDDFESTEDDEDQEEYEEEDEDNDDDEQQQQQPPADPYTESLLRLKAMGCASHTDEELLNILEETEGDVSMALCILLD